MRVMLLGASGMLASDLRRTAPADATLLPYTSAALDLTDEAALARALDAHEPAVVINAAAYTAVDRAELERERAERVNGHAVGTLGRLAAARNCRVVHFGTDYVFDGNGDRPYAEDDPTRPVNAYGASKLLGEELLLASGATALVVRTQWLFGRAGRSFPRTMWERAARAERTRVVADQTGRPTYTRDLAAATWQLVARGAAGVLHVANEGAATWYDVARAVFEAAGRPDLLEPCTTADFPTPARRPRYSVLATDRAEALLGGALPGWRDALARFLADDLA